MKIGQGIALVIALVIALSAKAELGGPPTWLHSEARDGTYRSLGSSDARASYIVNQSSSPSEFVVHAYIAAASEFAIASAGAPMPPLNPLLGACLPSYMQRMNALQVTQTSFYRPSRVEQTNLVVLSGGHMGGSAGRAYPPQALPQGVSVGDIH